MVDVEALRINDDPGETLCAAAAAEIMRLRDEVSDLRGCIDAYRRWVRECPIKER